jgi:TPR repeat protein
MNRIVRSGLVALGLLFALATPVAAGPFEDGLAAYERGDYATAFRLWRPLAEQGEAKAQNNLGVMYDKGLGAAQDYAEAVKWYRRAAEQGDAGAQHSLGFMYAKGHGVAQDYAEALKWYRRAAEQGNARAQHNLGGMYAKGHGVAQDNVQAHKWVNLAATKGDSDSVKARDFVASVMTPQQIDEAQRLAREWKPKTWAEVQRLVP